MTAGLAITGPALERSAPLLDLGIESAGIARGRRSGTTVLVSDIAWVDDSDYELRERDRLKVRSAGWAPGLRAAARDGDVPVFVHTHPGGDAFFSPADNVVDATIGSELARLAGCSEVASLVIGSRPDGPRLAMRRIIDGRPGPREAVRVAGILMSYQPPPGGGRPSAVWDRQDRAFGPQGRAVLEAMTIGVVGAGGTGSPTVEQLLRLGVGTVITIDDDIITEPTPTRTTGTGTTDLNMYKVDAMARLNDAIALGSTLVPLPMNVRDPAAEDALATCDVIFGCTDGHYSRIVLNRIAYYHLVPVIDLGVLVTPDPGTGAVRSIDGRITVIAPGGPCLLCLDRIDTSRARAENMDPAQRRALAAESYLADIDEPAPAVVTYTTMTSSFGVTTLLHRLYSLGNNRHTELFVQPLTSKIRTTGGKSRAGCKICGDESRWGLGFMTPRLGLA